MPSLSPQTGLVEVKMLSPQMGLVEVKMRSVATVLGMSFEVEVTARDGDELSSL